MTQTRLLVSPPDQWAAQAAASILRAITPSGSLPPDHRVSLALAGGSTPAAVYESLTQQSSGDPIWEFVDLYLSDERMVPLDDPESNYRMAREHFVDRLRDPAPHIFPVDTAQPVGMAADGYEELIRQQVTTVAGAPSFDVILLGLGEDGHTASLFPGAPALGEQQRLVVPAEHPDTKQPRVTFTLPLIAATRLVMFLVRGTAKAEITKAVMADPQASNLPAARAAAAADHVLWLADEEAASKLSHP